MRFGMPQREWEGPIACEFEFDRKHTKTARYKYKVKRQVFEFYAPLFMLKGLGNDEVPDRLQVVIWKSESPVRTFGYLSEPIPLRIESDVLEYEFTEEKVNSKRYDLAYKGQNYALYIPNEIFGIMPHPKRVFVQMAVI